MELYHHCDKCNASTKNVDIRPYKGGKLCDACLYLALSGTTSTGERGTSWNTLVTPHDLPSFIGQKPIKGELETILKATKKHGIPVQHVLFSGSFGLGKTTLAIIFAEMIGSMSVVTAANLDKNGFPDTKVVVVDETHSLKAEEILLGIMDHGQQTILGTTTTAGSLSGPLRSRFISLVLQPYTVSELQQIIDGAAKNLKYDCPTFVSYEIARRGKTVARISLFLFKRIYDRITLSGTVTEELLEEWFEAMKIDGDGLDNADRAYLNCLSNKPIGVQNISAVTGLDKLTIEETIEPYLLTSGFIKRTPRGRVLGDKQPQKVWE